MSAIEGRKSNAQLRALQVLLVLMLLWNLLAVLAALSFGNALMKIDGNEIGGILGAKTSLSGAGLVPATVYFYGLVRNPIRNPGVIWVGMVEQGAAILVSIYHVVSDHLQPEGAILTVVVSVVFLALLIVNLPRGDASG